MSMVMRQMRARYRALQAETEAAMEHFETHPDFPAAQVAVLEGIETLKQTAGDQSKAYETAGHLKFVLELLDTRARGYLALVGDMASQKAYMKLVAVFGRKAVEEYFGLSSSVVWFSGETDAERIIADRVRHWTKEGYKRLIPLSGLAEPPLARRGYSLYFAHYNFCRIHRSLRVTPAMEAKITEHVWELSELLA